MLFLSHIQQEGHIQRRNVQSISMEVLFGYFCFNLSEQNVKLL